MAIYNDTSDKFVKMVSRHLNCGQFDIYEEVSKFTLDALLRTLMDLELDVQNQPDCPYSKSADLYFEYICKRISSLHLHPDAIFKRSKLYKKCQEMMDILKEPGRKVLKNRKGPKKDESEKFFIDRLLQLEGENFSKQEIENEVHMLIFGGFENTGLSIANTILLLAMFPDVQEKVVQELRRIFPDKNSPIFFEDLSKLKYMEMTIKDAMRLHPVAPIIFRSTVEDVQIGNFLVPKGTNIAINSYGNHLNEKYWDTPNTFNPDHFLPEKVDRRHRYVYLAFSAGPRDCIGEI
jgi:cytochrome P450